MCAHTPQTALQREHQAERQELLNFACKIDSYDYYDTPPLQTSKHLSRFQNGEALVVPLRNTAFHEVRASSAWGGQTAIVTSIVVSGYADIGGTLVHMTTDMQGWVARD